MYRETIDHFGEPDHVITFDEPQRPDRNPLERIDVLVWEDDEDLDVTTFATIGMCAHPLAGAAHRCELHFAARRPASEMDLNKVALFCAGLAACPFADATYYDWGHAIINPGRIPYFPNCCALILSPGFGKELWDETEFEGTAIRIMNLVPITRRELEYGHPHDRTPIFDYLADNEIDVLVDRDQ